MQIEPATPARADACTPLQSVLHSATVAECISADFKKRTLTFKLGENHPAHGGAYYLLPVIVGQLGIKQEQAESAREISFPPKGTLSSRYMHSLKELALEITGENGYEHTFYFCRTDVTKKYPKPTHWWGHLQRCDTEGNLWSSQTGEYVIDNFGDLVRVSC